MGSSTLWQLPKRLVPPPPSVGEVSRYRNQIRKKKLGLVASVKTRNRKRKRQGVGEGTGGAVGCGQSADGPVNLTSGGLVHLCPIVLVYSECADNSGWSIIVPNKWVMPFWRELVLSGVLEGLENGLADSEEFSALAHHTWKKNNSVVASCPYISCLVIRISEVHLNFSWCFSCTFSTSFSALFVQNAAVSCPLKITNAFDAVPGSLQGPLVWGFVNGGGLRVTFSARCFLTTSHRHQPITA